MNDSFKLSNLQEMRSKLPWGAFLFLLTVFFFAHPCDLFYSVHYASYGNPEAIENRAYNNIEAIEVGNLSRQLALFSLGFFAIVSLFRKRNYPLKVNGLLGWFIIFFLIWACLSITWADNSSFTFRRLGVLGILSISALSIAEIFTIDQITKFAFLSSTFSLLLGFICEITLGTFRPLESGYRFGGQMNPIYQAVNCGVMIISALALLRKAKSNRFFYIASVLFGFLFIALTKSRGPMVSTLIGTISFLMLIASKYRKVSYIIVTIIVSTILLLLIGDDLFIYAKQIVLLGRNETFDTATTLTGRIPLWQECFIYIAKRPLLGYGYDSFFTPDRFIEVYERGGLPVSDVHNGFIDLILGLGLPGPVITVLILLLAFRMTINFYNSSQNVDYAFAFSLLLMFTVNLMLLSLYLRTYIPSFVVMVILAKLGFTNKPILLQTDETTELKSCKTY